ncbi:MULTISPECIES: hypothetical protein [unclassified Streptomyces]|uniref:hypothetical protein n=1 Tax=unclassified Streptomyces TaxID=2593676 RepID=UPI0011AF4F2D|nr:hypothetical protein [Streptomyces sp. CB02959]
MALTRILRDALYIDIPDIIENSSLSGRFSTVLRALAAYRAKVGHDDRGWHPRTFYRAVDFTYA